jgi:hypothetical protein
MLTAAGTASAQTVAPIAEAPLPTYDDWNLSPTAPGDQPPVFGDGDVIDRRQQLNLRLLAPAGDVMAVLPQGLFLPGDPGPEDEVQILVTPFWDARRGDLGGDVAVGAGINIGVAALSFDPFAVNTVSLATLTSNQALADTFNTRGVTHAVVADHLSILAERSSNGSERTRYLVRVRHRDYGINFTAVATSDPPNVQVALNPLPVQTLLGGTSGDLSRPARAAVQFAQGALSRIWILGNLGTALGRLGDLRVDPDGDQVRWLDFEARLKVLE